MGDLASESRDPASSFEPAPPPALRIVPSTVDAGPTVPRRTPGTARPTPGSDQAVSSAAGLLEVFRGLDSGPRGLTEAQAGERLARFGENVIPDGRDPSWPRLFARSLRDPFTAVLLCLGLVSAAVLAWGTASVILLLVVVSGVLRASGEHRADRSTAGLRRLVAHTVTVQRRAHDDTPPVTREIPVEELVPGDVVRLVPGDLIPADVRLLRSTGLTVHQAALTGESAPVEKAADAGADDAVADDAGMDDDTSGTGILAHPRLCFQGSSVASGNAIAVVTATGAGTLFAAAHRRTGKPPRPPSNVPSRASPGS